MIAEKLGIVGRHLGLLSVLGIVLSGTASAAGQADNVPKLTAESFDSGFKWWHDTYNGMGTGSDGKIYYVLCTTKYDVAGQMYCFDPATKKIKHLGDLTEACGEKGINAIAQGKIHNNFVEYRENSISAPTSAIMPS